MGFKSQTLRYMNAFPRAEEHLTQKTITGAAVSIAGLVIMATLFIHELNYYMTTVTHHEMAVDVQRGQKLPIIINITFPSLPCQVLSLDAIDMSGKHEVDLDTNIWKIRLNKDGHILGSTNIFDLVEGEHKTETDKEHMHEGDHEIDIHGHYHRSISDPARAVKEIKQALADGEGCRVYGVLDVERVAGNFHVSMHGLSIFVAQQIYQSVMDVNVSHVIHDLSFGPKFPGIHNPLDGTERILHETSGTFKYFLKIVPTMYEYLNGKKLPSNQFSVTEYFTPSKIFDRQWPAAFFVYDLSPIIVTIKEERRPFSHFLTRLCAVLGGTFAVTGMLDRWVFRLVQLLTDEDVSKKGKGVMR